MRHACVLLLQILFIGAIVACLYIGYFVVQSTEMDYIYQVRRCSRPHRLIRSSRAISRHRRSCRDMEYIYHVSTWRT